MRVLPPGVEKHGLPVPVRVEHDAILNDEWIIGPTFTQGGLHEYENAIATQDLHIVKTDPGSPIHVDPERGRCATLKSDIHQHGVRILVAHGESLCHTADGRENRIEKNGVLRKDQLGSGIVGDQLVFAATE